MSDNKPASGTFCWNELMTVDVAQAKTFYSKLLGWECHDIDIGDMTYTIFKQGDKDIAGLLRTPKEKEAVVPPHWMSYIAVDHIEDMTKRAETLGATIRVPVTTLPGAGQFSIMTDPTDATFAFWQASKS